MSTWAGVSGRLGAIKAETRSIAEEVYNAAKKAGHDIWFIWGLGASAEHSTGLALDLMVRSEAAGDWVRDYLWNDRRRLRLRHVIWEQHITSTTFRPGVRILMEDRGNSTANHYDHVHLFLFAGKYQAPVAAPPIGEDVTPAEIEAIAKRVWTGPDVDPSDGRLSAGNTLWGVSQGVTTLLARPAGIVALSPEDRDLIIAGLVAAVEPIIRDAVADLGEGGATQVRADA